MIRVNKIKSLLALVVLLFTPQLALKAAAQIGSATVVAQGGFALQSDDVLTLQAQIVGCTGNVPLYNGVPVSITPNQTAGSPFTANASQFVSFVVPGNDKIICGGQNYTQYAVTWKINGFPAAPTQTYRLADNFAVSLNSLTPTGFYPPNLANAAGFACPAGTSLQGFNLFWTPNCGPTITANMPSASGPGQLLVSPAAGNNWTTESLVLYQQGGDTLTSIEAACASFPCTYYVTGQQVIAIGSNHTLSANVNLVFLAGGQWTVNGAGTTLTIPSAVQGTSTQHFIGTSTVKLGANQPVVPVEWFGAVGDWNGSTGTDNTVPIQRCLNALVSGQCLLQAKSYMISAALTINRSNIGLKGSGVGIIVPGFVSPTTISSALYLTSSTADFIDCLGTGTATSLGYNQFNDFAMRRTVAPAAAANTAVGLRLSFLYGTIVNHLSIEDNNAGILFHAVGSQGLGAIENVAVTWGYGAVHETSGSFAGFLIDSSDGLPSPSLRIRNSLASSALGSLATTFGILSTGQALEDLHVTNFETAGVTVGEQFSVAGGATSSLDIHLWNVINDTCLTSCMVFNSGLSTAATIEINGGWNYRSGTGTSPVIDFEGAFNATVANTVIYSPNAGSGPGIFINGGSKILINGDTFLNGTNSAVSAVASSFVTVTNNMMTNMNAGANSIIQFAGVNNGIVSGNEIAGVGAFGISLDAATHGIAGLPSNSVNGTFTGTLNDLGINPSTPSFFAIGGNGSVYKIRQKIRLSGALCTAAANNGCTFTLTWPNAFPDTSWQGICMNEASTQAGVIWTINPGGKTTTTATVQYFNLTASSNALTAATCEGWE